MPRKIIHVNRHKIAANKKFSTRDPVLAIKTYNSTNYANEIYIDGPCKLIYTPDKPLSCGATVYIVVDNGISVTALNDNEEIKIE